jgi:hypothetical protein
MALSCARDFKCGYIDTDNPNHDIDHGVPSHDYLDQGCNTHRSQLPRPRLQYPLLSATSTKVAISTAPGYLNIGYLNICGCICTNHTFFCGHAKSFACQLNRKEKRAGLQRFRHHEDAVTHLGKVEVGQPGF